MSFNDTMAIMLSMTVIATIFIAFRVRSVKEDIDKLRDELEKIKKQSQ